MSSLPIYKVLTLSTASFAILGLSTSAMAGEVEIPAAHPMVPTSGIYLEGNLGYARINYADTDDAPSFSIPNIGQGAFIATQNLRGGFSFGFDAGYQLNQYWAIELGWYYLPETNFRLTTQTIFNELSTDKVEFNSWGAYLALKIMIPFMVIPGASLFFKGGLGYRRINLNFMFTSDSNLTIATGKMYKWSPMFAVGLQWMLNHNWIFDLQYMRFPGGSFANEPFGVSGALPAANIFTISLGYMLPM
jgi:opacity protein-like surface antigen